MPGDRQILRYGDVPVPYTASWSDEETHFLGRCPYFNGVALCQIEKRGSGKPLFGKPHSNRQREVIALGLCDLCARPLKTSTKVSLSHARPVPHGAQGLAILQVEPMLHRECAIISMNHCPSLKRDVKSGSVMIRQVTRHRVQCAIMDEVYTETVTGRHTRSLGHAKVELVRWIDRDLDWLTQQRPSAKTYESAA